MKKIKYIFKRALIEAGISPCCFRGIIALSLKQHACKKCGTVLERFLFNLK